MKVLAGDFYNDGTTDAMKFDVPVAGTSSMGLWVGQSSGGVFFTSGDGDGYGFGDGSPGSDTHIWSCWDTNITMKTLVGDFDGDRNYDVVKFDVAASGKSTLGLWIGISKNVPNPIMRPTTAPDVATRNLTLDDLTAINCYYR
jgi:hypothetical protein